MCLQYHFMRSCAFNASLDRTWPINLAAVFSLEFHIRAFPSQSKRIFSLSCAFIFLSSLFQLQAWLNRALFGTTPCSDHSIFRKCSFSDSQTNKNDCEPCHFKPSWAVFRRVTGRVLGVQNQCFFVPWRSPIYCKTGHLGDLRAKMSLSITNVIKIRIVILAWDSNSESTVQCYHSSLNLRSCCIQLIRGPTWCFKCWYTSVGKTDQGVSGGIRSVQSMAFVCFHLFAVSYWGSG